MGLLFTYALTYGGALVSLFNPFYGLLIYICFAISKPEVMWPWSVPVGNYSRIVAISLLLGWVLRGFGNWQLGRAKGVVFAFIGFWLWAVFSGTFAATDHDRAFKFVEENGKILLPFLVGVTVIESPKQLTILIWVIVASVGYFALRENETYYLYGMPVGDNLKAHMMVVGSGLAFFSGLASQNLSMKTAGFAAAALMIHAAMFHMSRAAMIGIFVVGALTFLVLPKNWKTMSLMIVALAIGLRLAGPNIVHEFMTVTASEEERDASAASRFDLWAGLASEIQSNPVLGLGPNHWQLNSQNHGFVKGKDGHCLWLQMGAEMGIPGLMFLLCFYGLSVWRLLPAAMGRSEHELPWLRPVAQMVVVSICAFSVEQMFGSFSGMELPYYVVLIAAVALKLSSGKPASMHYPQWAGVGHGYNSAIHGQMREFVKS